MDIPGRILIVDNIEKDVKSLIDEFMNQGISVIYTQPYFINKDIFKNIRLVIFDYLLYDDDLENSLDTISLFINSIYNRTKFFIIVIWSAYVNGENKKIVIEKIKENYQLNYGVDIPGIILEPINKEELNSLNLIKNIEKKISSYPELKLTYEIENVLDNSRDLIISTIYEFGNWNILLSNIGRDINISSINRYLINIYINIIKRQLNMNKKINTYIEEVLKIKTPIDNKKFAKIYSLQNYYEVNDEENLWTGDILFNNINKKYYIVITAECDFAQNKYDAIKAIEAEKITNDDLINTEKTEQLMKIYNLPNKKEIINAIFNEKIQKNYLPIVNIFDNKNNSYYHFIINLDKTIYLPNVRNLSELTNFSRIIRIDSPLINYIQQKYAYHCSRIGILPIPKQIVEDLRKIMNPKK